MKKLYVIALLCTGTYAHLYGLELLKTYAARLPERLEPCWKIPSYTPLNDIERNKEAKKSAKKCVTDFCDTFKTNVANCTGDALECLQKNGPPLKQIETCLSQLPKNPDYMAPSRFNDCFSDAIRNFNNDVFDAT